MIKSFGMIIADMREKVEEQLCSCCFDKVPRWIAELEAWRNYQDMPNGEKIDLREEEPHEAPPQIMVGEEYLRELQRKTNPVFIQEAVARGWCHQDEEHPGREMDAWLAEAIVAELLAC